MKIIEVPIQDIANWKDNPRSIEKEDLDRLSFQIKRLGVYKPLLVTKALPTDHVGSSEWIALGGNMRLRAFAKMGFKKVTVSVVEADTQPQRIEYSLSDNDRAGNYDQELLSKLIVPWKDQIDMGMFAVDLGAVTKLDGLIEEILAEEQPGKDDIVPEVAEEPIARTGDLYLLGPHRLLCGDATDPAAVKRLMDGEKAGMIYTDPPYGVSYRGTNNPDGRPWGVMKGDELRGDALYGLLYPAFQNAAAHSTPAPAVYVWHASATQIIFEMALNQAGFEVKEQLIWNKGMVLGHSDYHWAHEPCFYARKIGENNYWYGDRSQKTILRKENPALDRFKKEELILMIEAMREGSTTWEVRRDSIVSYVHPTQKPVDLAARALLNTSLPGIAVLDLFVGSGTTIIACEKFNRKAYAMEKDHHYTDVVIRRYLDYTQGRQPVFLLNPYGTKIPYEDVVAAREDAADPGKEPAGPETAEGEDAQAGALEK